MIIRASFYYRRSFVVMFPVPTVRLYVCNTITFESLDVESSFLICR